MTFLAAAFIGVWVLVTGYLIFMSQRQRQLEQEMRTLEELLAERNKAGRRA
jgi:CcmD family protein